MTPDTCPESAVGARALCLLCSMPSRLCPPKIGPIRPRHPLTEVRPGHSPQSPGGRFFMVSRPPRQADQRYNPAVHPLRFSACPSWAIGHDARPPVLNLQGVKIAVHMYRCTRSVHV